MSACISSHGEYDAHETDPDTYVCKWCHEFDETGAMAEIARLRGGPVTGMEDAIEQVARALYAHRQSVGDFPDGLTDWDDLPEPWRDEWREAGEHVVRALADAGLLAPAPLPKVHRNASGDWENETGDRVFEGSVTADKAHESALFCLAVRDAVDRAEGDGRADQ